MHLHQIIRELDDQTLIQKAREGRREYFDPLVERYGRLVRVSIWNFFRDQQQVEDLSQEAFSRAFESLGSLQKPDRFKPWLLQITLHLCQDQYRRRKAGFETEDIERFTDLFPARETPPAPDESDVIGLWNRLPAPDAHLIWLRFVEEVPYADIAEIMGMREPAVRQRACRALRKLREYLA